MKKTIFIFFLFQLTLVTVNAQQTDIHSIADTLEINSQISRIENGLPPGTWAFFNTDKKYSIKDRMEYYKVPGVSIAVIKNGKIVWAKGYGFMNSETKQPVTPTTLFQAASMSKSYTATVIIKLVEQGRLSLEEDINKYLSTWKLPSSEYTKNRKVSLADLLTHTGGINLEGDWGYKSDEPVPSVYQILNGTSPAHNVPVISIEEPGTRFRYSAGGYMILQLMLMDMENKPFPQIMKEYLLEPLGLNNSTFSLHLPEELEKRASTAHEENGKPVDGKYYINAISAAAGSWSTPTDISKFLIEHFLSLKGESNKILSLKGEEMMFYPIFPKLRKEGLVSFVIDDRLYFATSGVNYGFMSYAILDPETGNGAVVMHNGRAWDLLREILSSIAAEYKWKDYVKSFNVYENMNGEMDRITGRYYIDDDEILEIFKRDNKYFRRYTYEDSIEIIPISENEFVNRKNPVYYKLVKKNSLINDTLLTIVNNSTKKRARQPNDKMIPAEYLISGDIEQAVKLYNNLRKTNPNSEELSEQRINNAGYYLLERKNYKEAIVLFKLNTEWYPNSWNTFDGLGEAYMKAGEKIPAIENYEKSLQLNPNNENAKQAIQIMQEEK